MIVCLDLSMYTLYIKHYTLFVYLYDNLWYLIGIPTIDNYGQYRAQKNFVSLQFTNF